MTLPDDIERLEAAATKGPWKVEFGYVGTARMPFLVRPGCNGIDFGGSQADKHDQKLVALLRNNAIRLAAAERVVEAAKEVLAGAAAAHAATDIGIEAKWAWAGAAKRVKAALAAHAKLAEDQK